MGTVIAEYRPDAMKRILYVEDSLASQWLLNKQLKQLKIGAEIIVASSLEQARTLLREQHFDLVIADWALPDGEALEFVRELRKRLEATRLPVIMVSASMDHLLTAMALRAGANDCFPKPIVWLDVLVAVEKMLTAPYVRTLQTGQIPVTWVEGTSNGRWWLYCPEVNYFLDGEDADVIRAKATQRVREAIEKGTAMPFVSNVRVMQKLV
jgi:CheY-like chemotaxis protein